MAPWCHGRIYLGGRWHEPPARALKLPAGDNSAYLTRWAAALAHEQSVAENKMRYQNIPPRFQTRASARHKIRRNESHGAFDWYREGCFGGGRGINLGHTYSLPWGVARTDRLGGERRRHRSAVQANHRGWGFQNGQADVAVSAYGQSGHPDCARPAPKMTRSGLPSCTILVAEFRMCFHYWWANYGGYGCWRRWHPI